jgi:hypothetical protein
MTVLKPQPKIHSAGTAPTPNHISNNALLWIYERQFSFDPKTYKVI